MLLGALQAGIDRLHEKVGTFSAASAGVLFLMTLILLFGPKVLSLLHLFARPKETGRFWRPGSSAAERYFGDVVFDSYRSGPGLVPHQVCSAEHRRTNSHLAYSDARWWCGTALDGNRPRVLAVADRRGGLGAVAWWIAPSYLAWLSPMLIGLLLAIPMRNSVVAPIRFGSLFLTPEELQPPQELVRISVAAPRR